MIKEFDVALTAFVATYPDDSKLRTTLTLYLKNGKTFRKKFQSFYELQAFRRSDKDQNMDRQLPELIDISDIFMCESLLDDTKFIKVFADERREED